MIEYLDVEELLHLVERLGAGPVRDLGLLDAAAARARSSAFGEDAYPTLELKAAALMHSLCRNHPLVDGNKPLALLATGAFLRLNARRFRMDHDGTFELVMAVADGSIDVPEIAARLTEGPE